MSYEHARTAKGRRVTAAQVRQLRLAANSKLGVVEYPGPRGLGWASWRRMMERLRNEGLVTEYVHGGYRITDAGRAVLEDEDQAHTDKASARMEREHVRRGLKADQ